MQNNHCETKYSSLKDEEILDLIKNGDNDGQDYIIEKYKKLVKIKARAYFIIGGDKEDIAQEGMIGLYKAIRDYNMDKKVSFFTFAELCITRQIYTAIKAATRQKHIPLNSYISLNKTFVDDENTFIDKLVEDRITNPEELLIDREEKNYIETHISEALSVFECRVLSLFLQGDSYLEIAVKTSKDEKSIDNALQRVRRKVGKILVEKNLTSKGKYAKIQNA